jgi:predicted nuclease of predicted toxin-antitoxin system
VKLLIDMNLTPAWIPFLADHAIEAQHWSDVGDHAALDEVIMAYALQHQFVVFTHDLDFGSILAVTHASGPSVVQVRTEDPVPAVVGDLVVSSIRDYESHLVRGALLTIEPDRNRWRGRILPLLPGIRT